MLFPAMSKKKMHNGVALRAGFFHVYENYYINGFLLVIKYLTFSCYHFSIKSGYYA